MNMCDMNIVSFYFELKQFCTGYCKMFFQFCQPFLFIDVNVPQVFSFNLL